METQLLSTLAQIAGIGGVALGVFLLIFRDVIRKKIFPQLTKKQAYRLLVLALVLTWSVAIAGIVAWIMVSGNGPDPEEGALRVNATLWGVQTDAKGDVVATEELLIEEGAAIGPDDLEELARWLEVAIGLPELPDAPPATLTIHVPADPSLELPTVRRDPDGPIETLMWIVESSKMRIQPDREALAGWRDDFQLEIRVPGYETVIKDVTWGEEIDEQIGLEPSVVRVGVEEFTGEGAGLADRLIGTLLDRERLIVTDPGSLEVLRQQIQAHNAMIIADPTRQEALRSLAVTYILGGSVQRVRGQ